jgi:ABC-2 type transport system permease protein
MSILAFIKRDFQIEKNYKLAFFMKIAGMSLYISIFYFMGFWLEKDGSTFGGGFFLNIFLGIVFANLLLIPLNCFSDSLRKEQLFGTVENLVLAPRSMLLLLAASAAYPLLFGAGETLLYLTALYFILPGISLNLPLLFTGIVLGLTSMAVLGIISASFIMAFKRGDPVNFLLNAGLTLLGGVFFPIDILPGWLFKIAFLNPVTHAICLVRYGFGLNQLTLGLQFNAVYSAGYLAVFSAAGLIFAAAVFNKALYYSKKTGSLGKY